MDSGTPIPRRLRGIVCVLVGHRDDPARALCIRCGQTHEARFHGRITRRELEIREPESAAYWRGVTDGRKVDRGRAYRLGHRRAALAAFNLLEQQISRDAIRDHA